MITISDLNLRSQDLFIRRHQEYINSNSKDIENGLFSKIESAQDTLKVLGLRLNKSTMTLESHYELINDLSIQVELYGKGYEEGKDYDYCEVDLQYFEERKIMSDFLAENEEYTIIQFDSEVFSYDNNTSMYDVLEMYSYLQQLNQSQQSLFVDVFLEYADSPINLAKKLVTHLKDW